MPEKPESLGGEQKQHKVKDKMEFGGAPWKALFHLLKSFQEVQTMLHKTMLKYWYKRGKLERLVLNKIVRLKWQ